MLSPARVERPQARCPRVLKGLLEFVNVHLSPVADRRSLVAGG